MATVPSIEFAQRHVGKGVARLSEDVIEEARVCGLNYGAGGRCSTLRVVLVLRTWVRHCRILVLRKVLKVGVN